MSATQVKLTCTALGDRLFEHSHAERIMCMNNNGGWSLPEDSEWEFKDKKIVPKVNETKSRRKADADSVIEAAEK